MQIEATIRAVFFDWDDTLVATFEAKSAHHKHVALAHYGKVLTDVEIKEHWGKPLHEMVCLLYAIDGVPVNEAEAMAHNKASHLDFPKVLFPDTIPTLQRLHETGRKVGVVTATARYSLQNDLDLHGVPSGLIDYDQTAEDTPFHKPDPRVFEPALRWLAEQGIAPEEVLYVGDGLQDMRAAEGAGFRFIGVETGLVTAAQFAEAGAVSVTGIGSLSVA